MEIENNLMLTGGDLNASPSGDFSRRTAFLSVSRIVNHWQVVSIGDLLSL
jgi:hypothetical protein